MNKWLTSCIDRCTPSCEEVARLASEALDRRLTLRERIAMRMHFTICYFCRRYHDQLACMQRGLKSHGEKLGQDCGKCLCAEEKAKLKEACRGVAEKH